VRNQNKTTRLAKRRRNNKLRNNKNSLRRRLEVVSALTWKGDQN
jgi:hypothetical protein